MKSGKEENIFLITESIHRKAKENNLDQTVDNLIYKKLMLNESECILIRQSDTGTWYSVKFLRGKFKGDYCEKGTIYFEYMIDNDLSVWGINVKRRSDMNIFGINEGKWDDLFSDDQIKRMETINQKMVGIARDLRLDELLN